MLQKTFIFIALCAFMNSSAQSFFVGKISGKITDKNLTGIDAATVTLHRVKDSSFVKAALSEENGTFELEQIKEGDYFLRVSHLQFEKFSSPKLALNANNPSLRVPDCQLLGKENALAEVNVKATKQFVERQLDKLVVNVENSIVAAGNSALEVLERSPNVLVNQESGLNLKGKAGVIVMIDGKPSPLSGSDLITYLRGIPASNIQTIEIITNPSARYDAAGNAGIINIKFKKDQRQGLNGSFTASYGQGELPKPSASMNFNYRKKTWNLFGSYSRAQPTQLTRFYINRKFFDANKNVIAIFDQNSYTEHPIKSDNARFGVDYYLGKKTILGVLFNGNWNNNKRDGTTDTRALNADNSLNYRTNTDIDLNENRFNGFGNFNFKHTFNDKGSELSADIDYGNYDALTLQDVVNQNFTPSDQPISTNLLQTNQSGNITVKSIKSDVVHPFSKTTKMEAGFKSSLVTSDNDVKFFDVINGQNQLDTKRSNNFVYRENINALYSSFSKAYKSVDVQIGLRLEHTNTKGVQLATGEEFKRDYVNWFPTAAFNWKQSENHQFSLSFSKRIDRPTYRQLNPFRIFVDTYTYVVGDPTLKPVITYNTEFSHTIKGKYILSLGYTQSQETITDIFVQDDSSKISYQIPANIQDFKQVNFSAYLPFQIGKRMTSTLSGGVYWGRYESPLQGATLVNGNVAWDANLNNTFNFGKGWTAELNGFYQARNAWGQFIIKDLAQVSAGVQKVSNDKKSTFKFSLSDIFLTNHISVIVQYQNQDFHTKRTWDRRVATLSYTYRFGKNTVAKARQRSTGVEDEKKRAS